MTGTRHDLKNRQWVELGRQLYRWEEAQPPSDKATWVAVIGRSLKTRASFVAANAMSAFHPLRTFRLRRFPSSRASRKGPTNNNGRWGFSGLFEGDWPKVRVPSFKRLVWDPQRASRSPVEPRQATPTFPANPAELAAYRWLGGSW